MKLTNIDSVSLLDKRGYLTIAITQKTEGRVYLRLQEGIRDWFYHIQSTVYESKKRRKFWVKGPTYPSHTNNRLARLYGENWPDTERHAILVIRIFIISECISFIFFDFIFARLGSDNNIAEEDSGAADDEEEPSDNNNNVPRGINRLSCKDQEGNLR